MWRITFVALLAAVLGAVGWLSAVPAVFRAERTLTLRMNQTTAEAAFDVILDHTVEEGARDVRIELGEDPLRAGAAGTRRATGRRRRTGRRPAAPARNLGRQCRELQYCGERRQPDRDRQSLRR